MAPLAYVLYFAASAALCIYGDTNLIPPNRSPSAPRPQGSPVVMQFSETPITIFTPTLANNSHRFDSAGCRANNTFVLPNNVTVDNYAKFCACLAQTATDLERINSGVRDVVPPTCNTDGTWNCEQMGVLIRPSRWCVDQWGKFSGEIPGNCSSRGYCQNACVRFGLPDASMGQQNAPGIFNVGICNCTLAAQQENDPSGSAEPKSSYTPQCSDDGSWKKLQQGFGGTWCVDANGNQITATSFTPADQTAQC